MSRIGIVGAGMLGSLLLAQWAFAEEPAEDVVFEGGATLVGQQLDSGNDPIDKDLTGSLDALLEAQAGPGKVHVYIEASSTPDVSASSLVGGANADAGTAVDAEGNGRVQVSEIYYAYEISGVNLNAGVIDLTAFADASNIANCEATQFVSDSLVNNPTIAFPDYVPALVLNYDEEEGMGGTVLVSGSHGLGDNPNPTYGEMLDLGKKNDGLKKGMFALVEVRFPVFDSLKLGGWLSTDEQQQILEEEVEDSRFGLYADIDGPLGEDASWAGRLGWNEGEESSELSLFASLAVERRFGEDALGIGAAWQGISGDYEDSLEAEGADAGDTVNAELYYRWQVDENWALSPHVQYWNRPNFVDEGEEGLKSDAWVFGLRVQYDI